MLFSCVLFYGVMSWNFGRVFVYRVVWNNTSDNQFYYMLLHSVMETIFLDTDLKNIEEMSKRSLYEFFWPRERIFCWALTGKKEKFQCIVDWCFMCTKNGEIVHHLLLHCQIYMEWWPAILWFLEWEGLCQSDSMIF